MKWFLRHFLSRWGDEVKPDEFPFKMGQQFQLAIKFTENNFLVAVNGDYLAKLPYREPDILSKLGGLKAVCEKGALLEFSSVEHMETKDVVGF